MNFDLDLDHDLDLQEGQRSMVDSHSVWSVDEKLAGSFGKKQSWYERDEAVLTSSFDLGLEVSSQNVAVKRKANAGVIVSQP